jgi:lipopolysaccharide/colanic/teichoic acid biosynthesis glycosyltransferase
MSATSVGPKSLAVGATAHPDGLLDELPRITRLYVVGKRAVDLVAGTIAALLVLPIVVVAAVAIRVTGRGTIFFRQERVGLGGRTFTMWKLRTMYPNGDDSAHRAYVRSMFEDDEPTEAENQLHKLNDRRVTPVGRILRKASIDELPQLINVLRGEMSLVGPRPALPWEIELFGPLAGLRSSVKPGITGLWQVSGRSRLTMREALELDCDYAKRASVGLDLRILLKTIPVVVLRQDAA